ncbi:hypothetical protein ACSBR2_042272 [Camellia fascicularis]
MGSTQPNHVNQKGKNIRVEVDDDDYISSDHEDDTHDAESFESVDDENGVHNLYCNFKSFEVLSFQEVDQRHNSSLYKGIKPPITSYHPMGLPMPSKRLALSSPQPLHEAIVVSNGDLHDNVETQHSQPLDVDIEAPREAAPQSSVSPSRHPRGLTRGFKVQAMVEKDGKLKVPIPQEYRAPMGDHASQSVSKIGVEVRTHLPDFSIHRWKHINEEVTSPMFQRLTDQFDIQGESIDVSKAVATKCGRSLSTHTYRLRIKYLNLKSAKGEEYARIHPPPECDLKKWKNLIDKKWNDSNWLKQSIANIDNRNQVNTKHRCGSKSLPVRVQEATIANGGQLPELPCVYKSTHFNDVTKQWISPECEKNYDNMIKIQAEHCSQPGVVPITPEELSVKAVLELL